METDRSGQYAYAGSAFGVSGGHCAAPIDSTAKRAQYWWLEAFRRAFPPGSEYDLRYPDHDAITGRAQCGTQPEFQAVGVRLRAIHAAQLWLRRLALPLVAGFAAGCSPAAHAFGAESCAQRRPGVEPAAGACKQFA